MSKESKQRKNRRIENGRRLRQQRRSKHKSGSKTIMVLSILLIIVVIAGIVNVVMNRNKSGSKDKADDNVKEAEIETVLVLNGADEVTIMLNSMYEDEGAFPEASNISGTVDTTQAGTYIVKYTYGEQTAERTVHVIDDGQIIMNLNGSRATYVKCGQSYIESGCHAIDQDEGNITEGVEISGEVDTDTVGDYEIIYTAVNSEGVKCSRARIVHVVAEEDFKENTKGIPVLMYHYVYTADDQPDELNTNYIEDVKLEEHLQYLTENDYYYPSYQELLAYINGEIDLPEKSVILTFDDGQKGYLNYGIPLLEKYEVPATAFIIASNSNADKIIKECASEYVSFQSHSYAMHQGGGSIGHGGIISAMSKDEIINDLKQAQTIVQNSEAFAYPYSDYTETAQEAVKEVGILCSFTTEYDRVQRGADVTALPRVRIFGEGSLAGFISQAE